MNVAEMRPSRKTAESLTSKFGHDGTYLEWCGAWHILRAQYQLDCAKYNLAGGFGTLPDDDTSATIDPYDRMKQIEEQLVAVTPKTALLAQQMLGIAVAILSHPYPDEGLSEGPVLEIVKNVKAALDWLPVGTRLESKGG